MSSCLRMGPTARDLPCATIQVMRSSATTLAKHLVIPRARTARAVSIDLSFHISSSKWKLGRAHDAGRAVSRTFRTGGDGFSRDNRYVLVLPRCLIRWNAP